MLKRHSLIILFSCITIIGFLFIGCEILKEEYVLNIEIEGEGTVNLCDDEYHIFKKGDIVELEAFPANQWQFKYWEGDVSETDSLVTTVFMDNNKTVKAFFVKPWLGVFYNDVTEEIHNHLNSPDQNGAFIMGVIEGSPAEEGGIKKYDIIREVDGQLIIESTDLSEIITQIKVGQSIIIKIFRDEEIKELTVVIENKPKD